MTVWGNHSPTMYPDLFNAKVKGERARDVVDDQAWLENDFIPTVGKRGAAIIEARGASCAASAANAAIDHVHDWVNGTPTATGSRWRSRPTAPTASRRGSSPRSPARARAGSGEIVEGLEVPDFSQQRIDATVNELKEEREAVSEARVWS